MTRKTRELSNWEKTKSFFGKKKSVGRKVALLSFIMPVAALVAFGILARADASHRGEMFPNTYIVDIDVTGMTEEEAGLIVEEEVVKPFMEPLLLHFLDRKWEISLDDIGLEIDLDGMIRQAYETGWDRSVFERVYRRTFNKPANVEVHFSFEYNAELLTEQLVRIAGEINRDMRNASVSFDNTNGSVGFTPSRDGYTLDVEASRAAAEEAVATGKRVVELAVAVRQPDIKTEDVSTILVVDLMGNTLRRYERDVLVKTYQVASGKPEFPTPIGKFYIIRKEKEPVWINPNSEWSREMPPRIEPGPGNPLGTRALVTNAAGGTVLIHGSSNFQPGLRSHGCIRMANWAVEELYEVVSVGTPLFIWTSSPLPQPVAPPSEPEDPGLESSESE